MMMDRAIPIDQSKWLRWAWLLLALAVAALRIVGLAQTPLSPAEATRALAAWDAAEGRGWPAQSDGSLLLVGNTLLFAAFGAGDGVARCLPMLAGIALTLLPWLWRRRLGDVGAFAAAVVLGCSPLLLAASRRVEGTTLGLLGAALLATALFSAEEPDAAGPSRRMLPALIITGLAVGLTGGASFFDGLLPLAGAWLLAHWLLRQPAAFKSSDWLRPALLGVVGALLISLGFGFRLGGWSGPLEGLAAWTSRWGGARVSGVGMFGLYEPLTLALALLGGAWAIARRERAALLLAVWGVLALLLAVVRPALPATGWGSVVLPFALLAGHGIQRMADTLEAPVVHWVLLHIGVSVLFWLPAGLAMAGHAARVALISDTAGSVSQWVLLLGVIVLVSLHGLIALLFFYIMPTKFIWRGAVLGFAGALLLIQLSFACGLSHGRPTSPAEPAAAASTSPDVWALRRSVDEIAVLHGRRQDTMTVALVGMDADLSAVLRWALREVGRVSVMAEWPDASPDVVITPLDFVAPTSPAQGWAGMAFVVRLRAITSAPRCVSLIPPDCANFAQWYLFRTAPDMGASDRVVLWKSD
ncbi:MAG TPA: hypothetical protein PKH77_25755 [Anaerolineae bacterium]|nr:hypothetical protein [Anaerolineae bacterium]